MDKKVTTTCHHCKTKYNEYVPLNHKAKLDKDVRRVNIRQDKYGTSATSNVCNGAVILKAVKQATSNNISSLSKNAQQASKPTSSKYVDVQKQGTSSSSSNKKY